MLKHPKSLFLTILIICSINFFEYQGIKGSSIRYLQFGYILLIVVLTLPFLFPKRSGFVLPVQLISFSIFLSILVSWISWHQSLLNCIEGTILSLVWFSFFYLKHLNFPVKKIEKIIVVYGIIYLILYFFQFVHADKSYFIDPETIDFSRGITRIVFPGRGLFYLTIFISINKLTTAKKYLWFWASLSLLGIVITVMQVTRQFIFATFLIYLFHFTQDKLLYKKIIIVLSFIGIMLFVFKSENPIVKGLIEAQDQTIEAGSDYIRVRSGIFFLTEYSISPINRILGNGVAYGENSKFKNFTDHYALNYGYYLADVGLIAVYARFGIFAVLGYLIIWFKSFTLRLPKRYFYLKYYLWFLLFTSLTSDTIYSSFDLIATVLVIYCYQTIFEKEITLSNLQLKATNTRS